MNSLDITNLAALGADKVCAFEEGDPDVVPGSICLQIYAHNSPEDGNIKLQPVQHSCLAETFIAVQARST